MPPRDADPHRADGAEDDGGVARRLARRSRTAAAVLLVAGAALLLLAVLLPRTLLTVLAGVVSVVVLGVGAVLTVRAVFWAGVSANTVQLAGGAPAVIGPPTPLSPVRPSAPLRRRFAAAVIPIRVFDGAQPGGGALLIHGRRDGVALVAGDGVRVWRAARSGPEDMGVDDDAEVVSGRFVIRRDSDHAVFVGTTRLSDVF